MTDPNVQIQTSPAFKRFTSKYQTNSLLLPSSTRACSFEMICETHTKLVVGLLYNCQENWELWTGMEGTIIMSIDIHMIGQFFEMYNIYTG